MNAALLVAAFGCFCAGALADIVLVSANRALRPLPYGLAFVGSGLCLAVGIHVIADGAQMYSLGSLLGIGTTTVRLDDLAGLFLTLLFAIGVAVSACSITWIRREESPRRRGLGAAYCTLLASVAAILLAADAFTFLFSWEMLTLSFYVLAGVNRANRREAHAAWLTLVTGKVSGACLLFGFLLLVGRSGSFLLSAWHGVAPGTVHDIAYALIVVGLSTKLGVVPLQAWMPVGYSAAPGPTRAAMAGIAANVGVYGLWRILSILGRPPVWLAIAVLLTGGITALLGIAFAGVQQRLSRVIAYSSIENAGIIITAFGVALAGAVTSNATLEAAGLLAASLHAVAHAISKSVLFAASANVAQAVGSDDLERLRGIGRSLPLSGWTFGAGALTLAGLPPTVGFVSEWFVLEALMQQFRLPGLALRLAMAGAGALIALTSGLAALAFVRILGLVFLGPPMPEVDRRSERGFFGRAGLVSLGTSCFALAAISPLEIRFLARGLSPVVSKTLVEHALKSPWVLQPTYAGFSILSPSWLSVVMPILFAVVTVAAVAVSRGRYFKIRRAPAWHSATSGVHGPSNYTAFGFANPLRHVLANILGTRREAILLETVADNTRGRGRVEYTTSIVEPVEAYLYRPIRIGALALARLVKSLQSGRLEAYVAYMLFALVVALAVTAGLR
ncbi:MAG TPA: proton-conducting transporter membrane subunit [Acidimicrobiales bacterium]|nr:proton-conducting transporter membrane subunit [Acidimicrobiales bacterium]